MSARRPVKNKHHEHNWQPCLFMSSSKGWDRGNVLVVCLGCRSYGWLNGLRRVAIAKAEGRS